MSDFAYGVPAPPPPPPPGLTASPGVCTLCDAPLMTGAPRCANCGLWMGGQDRFLSTGTLVRVGLAFAAVYALTVLLIALAR